MNAPLQKDRLVQFIERIERLEEEKTTINEDIKSVFAEAKAVGYDVKTMRQIIRLKKLEEHDRIEQEELLEIYKSAIGL